MTTRVYVGNLPMDIRTREVEDIFYKYGRIRDIDVKFPSRPPAFAFVEFEDSRDAEDAIRGRDGYEYDGARLRVEAANSGRRDRGAGSASGARFGRNIRGSGEFSVEVSGLPDRASWQDLKDFMRKAGDVVFSEVDGRGRGVVEYGSKRDMNYAIEKLDDTEFRGRGESAFVRVRAARGRSHSQSRSRSRSRRRSRSRSRSSRNRSRSKKRSRSRSCSAHSKSADKEDEHKDKKSKTRSASRSKSGSRSPDRKPRDDDEDKKKAADEDVLMDDKEKANKDKDKSDDKDKTDDQEKSNGKEKAQDKEAAPDANGKTDASESDGKEPAATQDWASMKDEELREELKTRGLETDGEREELIKRLEAHNSE